MRLKQDKTNSDRKYASKSIFPDDLYSNIVRSIVDECLPLTQIQLIQTN